ncbi:MAG: hypothetical protein ABI859_12920 [Pseudomonadota bacterium]
MKEIAALAALALSCCGIQAASAARPAGDVLIDGKNVYPESISSMADGTLFNGSMDGIVYRAGPKDSTATPFIRPDATNGLLAVFGVLADERAGRLWVCSVANPFAPRAAGTTAPPSALVAFNLATGRFIGSWPFPAPGGVCNDIAIARDGSAYAADTPGGRILKLPRNGKALTVVAESEQLKGIDGLAFAGDGKLYVNIVSRGELLRVDLADDASKAVVTQLKLTRPLAGPDGFRPVGGNRFLLAEGTGGRIDLVIIDWDIATIRVLRDGLGSSASVTAVGKTAFTADGKINYLVDPKLRGQDPGTFKLIAVPFE